MLKSAAVFTVMSEHDLQRAGIVGQVLELLRDKVDDDTLLLMVANMVAMIESGRNVSNEFHQVINAFATSMRVHVELFAPVGKGELICVEYDNENCQSYWGNEVQSSTDMSVHGVERKRLLTDGIDDSVQCKDHPDVGSVVVAKKPLPIGYQFEYVTSPLRVCNFITHARCKSPATDCHCCAAYIVCALNTPPGLHILPQGFEQLEKGALCADANGPSAIYCRRLDHQEQAVNNAALSVALDRATLQSNLTPQLLPSPVPRLEPEKRRSSGGGCVSPCFSGGRSEASGRRRRRSDRGH